MWLTRFLIATVCFAVLAAGVYGIGHVTGCDTDQRDHLVVEARDGRSWLRHPHGFRLIHPGPSFVEDRALADRLQTLRMSCDAYTTAEAALTVCVLADKVDSRDELARHLEAARRGIAKAVRESARHSPGYLLSGLDAFGTVDTIADDLGWQDGQGSAYLHVVANGVRFRLKAFTLADSLVVLIASGNGLEGVADSLARTTP